MITSRMFSKLSFCKVFIEYIRLRRKPECDVTVYSHQALNAVTSEQSSALFK